METPIGLLFVLISGTMVGCAMAPIRFMRSYRFENYWALYNLVATVLIPWGLAFATIPNLLGVYRQLPLHTLLVPALFAFSWGIASTLAGMCISRIGLSLTYALISGVGASAGALVPLLYFSPRTLGTNAGRWVLLGVAIIILGVTIVAQAGREKEGREKVAAAANLGQGLSKSAMQGSFSAGLAMAILAGILSAGLNFSFAFGQDISGAVGPNVSKLNATYAVWAIAMLGGMIPTLGYALVLCAKNRSWKRFAMTPLRDAPLSITMGVLFMGSVAFYGVGTVKLGLLGTSVGWAIMQVAQIATGNVAGFLLGEWKIAGIHAIRRMFVGLAILTVASVALAYGNYLQQIH
ncbi:MAG: L-rhamnose/proton symporter RhaT [Candidatus Sulfotelmatobacter sp.]